MYAGRTATVQNNKTITRRAGFCRGVVAAREIYFPRNRGNGIRPEDISGEVRVRPVTSITARQRALKENNPSERWCICASFFWLLYATPLYCRARMRAPYFILIHIYIYISAIYRVRGTYRRGDGSRDSRGTRSTCPSTYTYRSRFGSPSVHRRFGMRPSTPRRPTAWSKSVYTAWYTASEESAKLRGFVWKATDRPVKSRKNGARKINEYFESASGSRVGLWWTGCEGRTKTDGKFVLVSTEKRGHRRIRAGQKSSAEDRENVVDNSTEYRSKI